MQLEVTAIKKIDHHTTLTRFISDFEAISHTANFKTKQKEMICKEQTKLRHGKQIFLLANFSFKQRFLSSTTTFSDSFRTLTGPRLSSIEV